MFVLGILLTVLVLGLNASCPNFIDTYKSGIEISGAWYEYKRATNFFSRGKCVKYTPQPFNATTVLAKFETVLENGKKFKKDIQVDLDKLTFHIHLTSKMVETQCFNITNDYGIYGNCVDDKIDTLVVVTRNKIPPKEVIDQIENSLKIMGNLPEMMLVDQNCK